MLKRTIGILGIIMLVCIGKGYTQELPEAMVNALVKDDSVAFAKLITKENMNDCYGNYSVLAQTVRANAGKCFNLLIAKGADVNKSCNGYVVPLMHAAKYGRLEMAKVLVAKGADPKKKYEGTILPQATGKNPIQYAQDNGQTAVVEYFNSLQK